MYGPDILVRTISAVKSFGNAGHQGQYHSRSDRHSKAICWAILMDLLGESSLLRSHALAGKLICGVNHEMRDFKAQRKKNLDLVLATPGTVNPLSKKKHLSFKQLVDHFEIALNEQEVLALNALPDIEGGPVGSVLLALEAKAAMTEHMKARPRIYDELNSSQLTIHGAADQAVAAGVVMINIAETFVSSDKNPLGLLETAPKLNAHDQPRVTVRMMEKIRQLPRRTRPGEEGFDALGIVIVDCENNGTPVKLLSTPPAPSTNDDYHYDQMIRRAARLYDQRFGSL